MTKFVPNTAISDIGVSGRNSNVASAFSNVLISVPTSNQFGLVKENSMSVWKKSISPTEERARLWEYGTGYQYMPGISATYFVEKMEPSFPNSCGARRGTVRSLK
ncbi:MAG: hypothetical protein F4Z01_07970 [Gammaproteobacteria bacterium]|nr:hypothetical protein [Gammaproteobacteria bacterium]MYF38847.1 hypothetical protein [Gammaproteobacteria bacterium]